MCWSYYGSEKPGNFDRYHVGIQEETMHFRQEVHPVVSSKAQMVVNLEVNQEGLPEGDLGRMALAQAPSKPDRLVMVCESKETKLYISEDSGENWKEQASTFNVPGPFFFLPLNLIPKDANRLYRPAFNMSISDDGGYSFYMMRQGCRVHADHHVLWINPANTSQMYLGTDGGVYMSVDRGK